MSYANLVRKLDPRGRVKVRPGQCAGRVEVPDEVAAVNYNYTSSKGKGSEYAAQFQAEEERAYIEQMMAKSVTQAIARMDVTCNEGSQMELPEELTSVGTVPNIEELNREDLTQVYNRYSFEPVEPSEHLESIFNEKEQIVQLIETNQVCVIKGPTGCGKSTQIPQFILDDHVTRQKHCNIVVTQPRRIAAISIAKRVCNERGWGEPGGLVGYQVGLDKKVEEDTRLLYCTTGVLLEKLITTKHMNDFTHVILDEVHEREEDMDFLMLVVRKFSRTNSPNVKIILMSATIDVKRFANYFGVIVRNKKEPAVTFEIQRETQFSVQVHYLEGLSSLGSLPVIREDEPGVSMEAYKLVPMMIRAFNRIDYEDFKSRRCNEKKGAVLIFLPGLQQIETLYDLLFTEDMKQKRDPENPDVFNLLLCPLHSSISKDEQAKVMALAAPNQRKVILSTNIAESSLTIPDAKYVIDFCLTKHLVADSVTGFTSLQMTWASHTNCMQREGRVGRVQDGRVYRMVNKSFYMFKMPKEAVPEMQRCSLEVLVLKCKRLMEDVCPLMIISNALDPPDLDNYEKTILKLKEIGALLITCRGENDPNDGDLTFMGLVMGSLPLDIRITKLILLGHLFDVLEDAIIMGCAMSIRNIFAEPFQARLKAYNNKLLWADSSESDVIAYLNAYLVWRNLTALGKFQRSRGSEKSWGDMYLLQIKYLKEVALLEDEIKKRLKKFNIQTERHNNKPLWNPHQKPMILKLVLAGAFYPNYYSCNAQNPNAEVEAVKMLAGYSPYQCVYLQGMPQPAPLYFDQVKTVFRENDISQNCMLHEDGSSKVIVEFKETKVEERKIGDRELKQNIPGEVLMPVYRAIKMRQLNPSFRLRIFPVQEVKERMKALVLNSRCSMISLCGQHSEYKPVIPWDQQMIEISICHVEDAGHFYAHIFPQSSEKVREVHRILNMSNLLCELSGEIEEGTIYAAPFRDEDDATISYYRAKIIKKGSDKYNRYVDVFFIDYGNSVKLLPVHDLREIVNEEFQKALDEIPPLALECVLAEVAPSLWSSTGGYWSKEASTFVKKTLHSPRSRYTWDAQIYSYVNGVAAIHLFLEDEGRDGNPPITLNEVLLKKGFAKYKEENYLSKINHAKREEIASGESSYSSVDGSRSVDHMKRDLMALPITQGNYASMKGPYSPLEMKLYGKIRSCLKKEVRVEWNSVNSVLLDSDPNDPHEKFLVAGFVSQSVDGTKLTLNHTTVLPGLHGLAALVCLLFAPSVELRSDEYKSRYIGAICGLGSDPDSGPLFPENDMEIKFDVEFTKDDLEIVNTVRYLMNQRFSSPDSEDVAEYSLKLMQQNIRDLMIRLLMASRPSIKVEFCREPYRWGIINEELLVPPFPNTVEEQPLSTRIYQLHYAIDLNPLNDFPYIQELVKNVMNLMRCVHRDLSPKELVCHLCDLNFTYWTQLRQHVTSRHHQQLIKWLEARAKFHKLSFDISPPPRSSPAAQQLPLNQR